MAKKIKKKEGVIDTKKSKIFGAAESIKDSVGKEIEELEQWMIERKKFLIKLGGVAGGIIVLLVISRLYLRVKGFG